MNVSNPANQSTNSPGTQATKDQDDDHIPIPDRLVFAVHPKLTEIPMWKGRIVALWAISSVIVFVIVMTAYTYTLVCQVKLAMIDADWTGVSDVDNALVVFEPYKSTFEPPTYICGSYGEVTINVDGKDRPVYQEFCLLGDLTCDDYGNIRCPDRFKGDNHICTQGVPPNCAAFGALASVVYTECTGFYDSFGVALAYLTYVQIAAAVLGYSVYRCCFAKHDDSPNPPVADIKEFVITGLGGGD